VLWVGGENGMEVNLVKHAGLPFRGIPAAGLHGVGLKNLPGNLIQLMKGVSASRRILKDFHPDVLLFTGGYVAVPMALAGRSVPSLLYVPDIEPGLALKTLARYADVIALTVEESKQFFNQKKRMHVTGYPTRSDLSNWTKSDSLKKLGCADNKQILLVLGGSKGARSINRALFPILPQLLDRCQIIHISGELDHEEAVKVHSSLNSAQKNDYHLFPYLHEEMGAALTAADLVVSRAGASILGEYPLFGLPAVLVPYPYAWRYQKVNADYLVKHGSAVLVKNENLQEELFPNVMHLLSHPDELNRMSAAIKTLSRPNAAKKLANLVLSLVPKGAPAHG
jgi:UDP-N-acetylglucosamine--N-acetylmuramyl-(pentapeptide) pyrophosphoryl-undecaprenol N-acetylglucosamine transferase